MTTGSFAVSFSIAPKLLERLMCVWTTSTLSAFAHAAIRLTSVSGQRLKSEASVSKPRFGELLSKRAAGACQNRHSVTACLKRGCQEPQVRHDSVSVVLCRENLKDVHWLV